MNNEVLEQLKQEYNETFNRLQNLGEVIANCADIDTNHCGQDADDGTPKSLKDLLGMEVIGVGGIASKCGFCGEADCVKVQLVGGDFLCLAKQHQDKRPVISFDEDDNEGLGDIMAKFRESAETFMGYLDDLNKAKK